MSSSPVPSADRSSVRAMPAVRATARPERGRRPCGPSRPLRACWGSRPVRGRERGRAVTSTGRACPLRPGSSSLLPDATILPLPITTRSSAMTSISWSRCEDNRTRAALAGEARQQVAHPPDPGRVEPVGGLVEDQHLGVPEQCGGDAEPLAHPEGVVAHPALGLGGVRLTSSSISSTRRRGRPMVSAAIVRISRPVRPACWAEASRRTPTSRPGLGRSANRSPSMVAVPDVGAVRPTITRIVVDLPAPFGPRKPVTSPGVRRRRWSRRPCSGRTAW